MLRLDQRTRYKEGVPRRRRRSMMFGPGGGSMLTPASVHRRRGPRVGRGAMLAVLALVAAAAAVAAIVLTSRDDGRHAAAQRFVSAWTRGDTTAMWQALDADAKSKYGEQRFTALVRSAALPLFVVKVPRVDFTNPRIARAVVDLPDPLSPTIASVSPGIRSKPTPSTA